MIESFVKAEETVCRVSDQTPQKDTFNPDKRIDTNTIGLNNKNLENYDPDKRVETTDQNGYIKNLGEIGTAENPRNVITQNEALNGDLHPVTGVPFEKRVVRIMDEYIEGVFPRFESLFDATISENLYFDSDKNQFKECNKQLLEAIDSNPMLKEKFSAEQLEQIKEGVHDGTAPDGYVWHHDAESGRLQLVDAEIHAKTGHTGGRSLWGGGAEKR